MIFVTKLDKYEEIILWGLIPEKIDKYLTGIGHYRCHIVDSSPNKQGKKYQNITVEAPTSIHEYDNGKAAIIILSLNFESDIYVSARRLGFQGDIYADDMIEFNEDRQAEEKNDCYYFSEGSYTTEKHTQILIQLMKEYNVKNIVASPGVCNICLVYSLQHDPFFKVWSCIDERSAAYMACGIAQTTGEPVALSCTGATASRNYMPALTEAFYSKLPVIAITSSRDSYMIGNGIDQITDRLHLPNDIVKTSVEISEIHNLEERRYCELKINRALNMLSAGGGGPVHINLITHFSKDFRYKTLPRCRVIRRIGTRDNFPHIKGKAALYIKSNVNLKKGDLTNKIEKFCEMYGAVVIGDHLSNYRGRFFIDISLLAEQKSFEEFYFDTVISIGEINKPLKINSIDTWRVANDGNIVDTYLNLKYQFDMTFEEFLLHYTEKTEDIEICDNLLYKDLSDRYEQLLKSIPDLPFSNLWVAQYTAGIIPKNSICYFGIFSSLKYWSFFRIDKTVECHATVGGYGIDGPVSALTGASLVNTDKMYFCFLGDLSFYYDMNVLGNRHIGNNVRIMIFNNNGGNSLMYKSGISEEGELPVYIGAADHYPGNETIKAYSESCGFKYICAKSKEEYIDNLNIFMSFDLKRPVVFEIVYDKENDFEAAEIVSNL